MNSNTYHHNSIYSKITSAKKYFNYNTFNLWKTVLDCSQTDKTWDSQQAYIDVKRIQIPWRTDPFGDKQIRYVSGGTCLKCLSLLGKFSASLGKGWVGSTWWPMTWHCVPQVTDSAQWGVANHRLPNWLLGWIKKLDA